MSPDTYVDFVLNHINEIDELMEADGDTPETYGHAERIASIIDVLPLSKVEKRQIKALLWRNLLEQEVKAYVNPPI